MTIDSIRKLYARLPQAGTLQKLLADNSGQRLCLEGLAASSTPLLFAAIADKEQRPFLFILPDADEAGYFYNDLRQLVGPERVLFFPSSYKRAVKYGQRDAANEVLRTEVLAHLSGGTASALFLVAPAAALAEKVVAKQEMNDKIMTVSLGQQLDITDAEHRLRELGFRQVDYVYEPGEFAVRGSILDVYSYSHELPFRIDFFGNEVDTLRTFEVEDQLSKDKRESVEIVPELHASEAERVSLLHFLPPQSVIVSKDLADIAEIIGHTYDEGFSEQALQQQLEEAKDSELREIERRFDRDIQLLTKESFMHEAQQFRQVEFGPNAAKRMARSGETHDVVHFHITPQPLFHKNFDLLSQSLADYIQQGYHIYICADSKKQTDRLRDIFDEMDASADDLARARMDSAQDSRPKTQDSRLKTQDSRLHFEPVDHTLHEGFTDNDLKVCFFTDHQIFDRFHKYSLKSDSARAGKMALTMKELQEMEPGDYIVHVDFGIGRFGGLVRVPTQDGYQEVIRIIYQNNDKVDVSIHSLYKVSKYRSQTAGEQPRLSTLGTGAWERMKERTKKKIKDIARDLIKLYAKRRHEKGFAYSPDSYMQHELEASFLYEDTPDQLKATQAVKQDMESSRPMDRLVCGDVGFGKTEVAIRAAFKAAADSKQVAVLVPTTVLAFQHYQTFRDRLHDFPVRVEYLSRARSAKQTKQVLADLKAGRVDILVGTHKLLGKNVEWHDLGLLIIDEEQKFGVATKERLRRLKTNVDTLTMSATPIPRTLQFSLMGARDMSIIRTPPPNRYPIQTEVCTFSSEVIADAINFEMSRNGQVFFVNNRISGLQELRDLIVKYVPDCRVAIGHGQMEPEELEKIIMGFINYDYDVLLSTTIVENGIDIPNANTIIINGAQNFGLSDLHQMRGRVGRSNRKAFCYLLAPPLSALPAESRRRLEAIETFSELGSGFNLAMQDLDIRGAGNLLGAEQSGFMEDLGYETYQKILSQAVTELKNDEFQDLYKDELRQGNDLTGDEFVEDCAVESDLQMYFPETYVPGASERMLLYRELDNITDDSALEAYRKRLEDRFGPVPKEGEELMQVVLLRRLGRKCGCEKIILRQGRMLLQFVSNPQSAYYQSQTFGHVLDYIAHNVRRCNLTEKNGRRLMRVEQVSTVKEAVSVMKDLLSIRR